MSSTNGHVPVLDPMVYLECLKIVSERDHLAESRLSPVMLNEIMAVEDELGVALPEQYEDFLLKVGPGSEYGGLAYWHHLDLTRSDNILELNKKLHGDSKKQSAHTLKKFLSVYDPCDGTLIGFHRFNGTYSPEMFMWSSETDQLESIADDFSSFLQTNIDCDQEELEEAERRAVGI